jgi:hypothetical protein
MSQPSSSSLSCPKPESSIVPRKMTAAQRASLLARYPVLRPRPILPFWRRYGRLPAWLLGGATAMLIVFMGLGMWLLHVVRFIGGISL